MTSACKSSYMFILILISALVSFESIAENKSKKATAVNYIETSKKDKASTPRENLKKVKSGGFNYRPPKRGAPVVRIGGGTRGADSESIDLVVISPNHTGNTVKEQPNLYWYVSKDIKSKVEVTLISDDRDEPVLERFISTPVVAGINVINLVDMGVKLKQNREYRWFVSIVSNSSQRSNDIVASGAIQRISPDNGLVDSISEVSNINRARIYAKEGIWYDAIDALMILDGNDVRSEVVEIKTSLLEQVGLQSVADHLNKRIN